MKRNKWRAPVTTLYDPSRTNKENDRNCLSAIYAGHDFYTILEATGKERYLSGIHTKSTNLMTLLANNDANQFTGEHKIDQWRSK